MTEPAPIIYVWDADAGAMVPEGTRARHRTYELYQPGQRVALVPYEGERSSPSHRHYFACVHFAWMNLREEYADRFPTAEHLRKWALIKAGYRDERTFVGSSKAEARRLAAFVKPMDDYAVVTVIEQVVTVYTAKSQAVRAMGKRMFQESKTAVLDVLVQMIDATREQLESTVRHVEHQPRRLIDGPRDAAA